MKQRLTDGPSRRLAGLAFGLFALALAAVAQSPSALDGTIADVERRWPQVTHISQDEVLAAVERGGAVLFDVRTADEVAVSQIAGATRVDPATSAQSFIDRHGPALKGKMAVFYCSVGVRSSKLAARVAGGLAAVGAAGSANLKGGIFGWANAQRPLLGPRGPTDKVHGYDASWSKLIEEPQRRTLDP